jgi:adenylosuccinate lyase
MPHKRNPVRCEQMCGLARIVRANLVPALEDVALWHERDISHSSVERVILPDSSMLAYYLLVKFREIVEGLEVFPERMAENLERSYGLVFSQPVLLALVASGLDRDAAYRIVQNSAMAAWEERRPFADILRENPEVTSRLTDERLAACFDLKAALANAGRVFDALDAPESFD